MITATKLLGNLNGEKSCLIHLTPNNLKGDINSMINFLVNKRQWSCIYVSVNKTYKTLKRIYGKKGYDMKMLYFIDAMEEAPKEEIENVFFVSSPAALTKISLAITHIMKCTKNKSFVFIDSLDGLSIYNSPNTLAKFIRSVIIKVTKHDGKVLVLTHGGVDKTALNKIISIFDKVIRV